MRSIGHQHTPPAHPSLDCLFQLLSAVTAFMHFCHGVSAPCVPGSFPLSLPCVDSRPDPAYWCCWLASRGCGQSNQTFFCVSVLPLVCCPPLVLITNLWPADTGDFAQRAVDKRLELIECWLSRSPWFWFIEEYWLHICFKKKILSLVDFPISLQLQVLLRIRKAVRALPTFAPDMCLSHPVCQLCFLNR